MNMNTNIFLKEDNSGLVLFYDMVLIEATRPIFFTCTDNNDEMYACSCHCANGEKCEWIIVPTTADRIIKVLSDEITIREVFEFTNENAFLVTLHTGQSAPIIKRLQVQDIPDNILPTAGYNMEPEEGEFDAEIAELREREKLSMSIEYISEKFFITTQSFCVKIGIPVLNWMKSSDRRESNAKFILPVQMGVQR